MEANEYDAIVVGARVAGSPTAMLLARMGYRVLVVDRASFPSDTMSTHLIHAPGMAALQRWGLAERVVATGCPPITTYRFDFGPFSICGRPRGVAGAPHGYAPRRSVLDQLLVDAAREAGVEVRQGFNVERLVIEGGAVRGIVGRHKDGIRVTERARIVVGADGVNSFVAREVKASKYNEVPALEALYLAYWSGLPTDGEFQIYVRGERAISATPTNDELTVALVAWPIEEFEANRRDLLGNYLAAFGTDPDFARRIGRARRVSRVLGTAMHNFYRQSYGSGWALVGDAGYHKDANTAQGISDAFHDAEALVQALDDVWRQRQSFEAAMAARQRNRDEATGPMYELTCQLASFEPPPAETAELLSVISTNKVASQDFTSMIAGTQPVPQFFDPANLDQYMSAASAA